MNNTSNETRIISIRLTDAEIKAVQDLSKVDAIAPAVVAVIRKAIEQNAR